MRLSSLVVAVLLLVSPLMFAQHSSAGGSSSGGSSSGGSSGGSSSSGGSHSGSAGGSSSGSYSSGGRSAGSSTSSISHSSGGAAPRSSSTGSAAARSNVQPSRSGGGNAIREPKNMHAQAHNPAEASKNAPPEHRKLFAFLRHPFRRHAPKTAEADLRRPCPPGQSPSKNRGCVVNGTTNTSNLCAGALANGVSCFGNTDMCASIRGQAAMAAAELRSINAEVQTACSGDPSGEECGSVKRRHEAAIARYRMLVSGAPANCRGMLVDPLSL